MRKVLILAICTAFLLVGTTAFAEGDDKPEWYERFTMKGDLRLRAESFDWDGKFDNGSRDRFRYRFRFGFEAEVSDRVAVGLELRSGNPDNPHSDNQSFDGGFDKNTIAIAQAYVDWQANDIFSLRAGKFSPKKLWKVSDMQWDDDVVVEGVMESLEFEGSDGAYKGLDVNFYQFILEESSSSGDAYMVGVQLRPTFALNDENQLSFGAGYDTFTRPDKVVSQTFSGGLDTEPGGIVTNLVDPMTGMLISDFDVLSAFAEWKNKSSKRWPVKVSMFYYKNLGAEDALGAITDASGAVLVGGLNGSDNDTGAYARLQVGDYKKPGQVALRLTHYDSEPDAIFYAWVQSDTVRGSNVDGDRLDVRVGLPMKSHVNFTYYRTDWNVGTDTTMNRYQLDYIIKF